MAKADVTADRVRELLHYDEASGIFTRKVRTAQRHHIGGRADFVITSGNQKGYYRVSIDSLRFMAHRVAWLYVYGAWPEHDIDHLDGDRGNNRIGNLRDVPNKINRQNMRKARKDSITGFLGVYSHQGKYRARVQIDGRSAYDESFDTPEQAYAAYVIAKRKIHQGCTL